MTSVSAAIEKFLVEVPELRSEWDAHVAEYDAPLEYVFFENVVPKHARRVVQQGEKEALGRLTSGLEFLAGHPDLELVNLVQVCFFEHLVLGDEADQQLLRAIEPALGPASRDCVADVKRRWQR